MLFALVQGLECLPIPAGTPGSVLQALMGVPVWWSASRWLLKVPSNFSSVFCVRSCVGCAVRSIEDSPKGTNTAQNEVMWLVEIRHINKTEFPTFGCYMGATVQEGSYLEVKRKYPLSTAQVMPHKVLQGGRRKRAAYPNPIQNRHHNAQLCPNVSLVFPISLQEEVPR